VNASLSPARRAVAAGLVTRLAVLAVAIAGAWVTYRHGHAVGGALHEILVAPWTRKDAGWFVHIAREGYAVGSGRPAFFPLYPLLVRIVGVLMFGNYWLAGVVVSLACYAGAMLLLYRLTAAETDSRTAAATVLLISVFPTAFVFGAVYSESLFLLLTVAAFYLAGRRRWVAACAAGALATLTRSSGIVLVAPLLLIYAEQRGWLARRAGADAPAVAEGASAPDARASLPAVAGAAWVLLVPAGLGVYMLYLWAKFGDALRFAHVQSAYWHRSTAWPWIDVWRGARLAGHGLHVFATRLSLLPSGLLPGHRLEVVFARALLPFGALVIAVICLVLVFRRLPLQYGVYGLLALLVPLFEPSRLVPLYSVHRFVLVVFPLFMGLAVVLERRRWLFWVVAGASFALMLYLTLCYTSALTSAHGVV
jgi:hypothetical protein